MGARRYAVIDVGTNSVKFHVAERDADGAWPTVVDRAEVTRLGEGLDADGTARARRRSSAPSTRSRPWPTEASRDGADAIAAVGTAGLAHRAQRGGVRRRRARPRRASRSRSISPRRRQRVAYLAAVAGLGVDGGAAVVFDTGGGSSQFTFGDGEGFPASTSARSRSTEQYGLDGAVSGDTVADALRGIAAGLARLEGRSVPAAIVGIGGAVTNLAAVKHGLETYDPDAVQGTLLERGEIDRQLELFRASSAEQRRRIVGLQPDRAEVILAGACIVRTVLDLLGRDALTVSDRGLPHGVLIDRFAESADGRREA